MREGRTVDGSTGQREGAHVCAGVLLHVPLLQKLNVMLPVWVLLEPDAVALSCTVDPTGTEVTPAEWLLPLWISVVTVAAGRTVTVGSTTAACLLLLPVHCWPLLYSSTVMVQDPAVNGGESVSESLNVTFPPDTPGETHA